jgi:hypothetical protein
MMPGKWFGAGDTFVTAPATGASSRGYSQLQGRSGVGEQPHDFARLCMPPAGLLGEHQRSIPEYFESAATRGQQVDLRVGVRSTNLGGQTGRPGFVVSHRAVFNVDMHGGK